jgi:DNA polymerase-3 subunit beta
MELSATAAIPCDGAAAIPCRKLLDVVRALPPAAVIRAQMDGDRLIVRSGRARFALATLPAEGFPAFDHGTRAEPAAVDPAILTAGLQSVAYAMGVTDVRYYLNGLLLEAAAGEMSLVASDGHRLARFVAPCDAVIPPCLVPRGVVLALARTLKGAASVALAVGRPGKSSQHNTLTVDLPGLRLSCKLIDGKFPDFQRVMPREITETIIVNRAALLGALDQAALLSDEKYKGAVVGVDAAALRITAANPEHEEAEITVDATLEGAAFEIGFNAVYLAAALDRLAGEAVTLEFPDSRGSCVVRDPDDGRQTHIVMPMRL